MRLWKNQKTKPFFIPRASPSNGGTHSTGSKSHVKINALLWSSWHLVDICRTKKLNYISVCLYDASKKALRIRIQTTYQRFMATVNSDVWCSSGRFQMIFLLSNRYPWTVLGDVHFLNNDLRKDTAAHASTVAIHYLQRFDNYETVRHIL